MKPCTSAVWPFNSSVEAVLTPSQKPKWRELRTATREKLKQAYEDKKDKE